MLLKVSVVIIAALAAGSAAAEWRAAPADPSSFPPEIVEETRAPAATASSAALPDGLVATGEGDIEAAWYEAPTRRYAHAILGDAVEAGALVARRPDGATFSIDLPQSQVFEDRYPRIADLDGDGRSEVIAIRASRTGGGGVAVYGLRDGRLTELAAIADIGRPNRWLNIAAIADLDGAPGLEIAFVKTPHIGGTLKVFAYKDGALTLLTEAFGFSNHAIGAREMRLSALLDVDGDGVVELAVPSADRRALRLMSVKGGALSEIAAVAMPEAIDKAILASEGGFIVGLRSGAVYRVSRAGG